MSGDSTIVEVSHVTKRFILRKDKSLKERLVNFARSNKHKEDFFALRDVSLDIEAGTTVGLIGPNGSGKSTLLKTLGGIIQPTSGMVRRRGRMAALLELGAGFHPDLSGRENVYLNASILGLTRAETDMYFDDIVEFSGIPEFIDTQVKFYSSGMYVRLAFAVAVHVNPDILIIDEVLAVGDEPFQRKCLDRVRQFQEQGKTIVLVSHSLEQVAELCSRVVVLVHGQIVYDGEPAEGVRVLREGFEEDRVQSAPQEISSLGTRLTNVRIHSSHAPGESPEIQPLSDLSIFVSFSTEKTLKGIVIAVEIETPLGHKVFVTDSSLLKTTIPSKSGEKTVEFKLNKVPLGEGTYLVNVALSTKATGEILRESQVAHFSVRGDGLSSGSSYIPVTASLSLAAEK